MRILLALLLTLVSFTAAADSFRFDRGVVTNGDNTATIIQKAGRRPDRIVELQNKYGAAVGERWEYYLRDKQVNIYITDGRVYAIEELR